MVGPAEGSKPREVYGSSEELDADEILNNVKDEDNDFEDTNTLENAHAESKKIEDEL